MKIRRKTPVFSAVVLRVLEIRFKEIVRVKLVSESHVELVVRGGVPIEKFIMDFDGYMIHLVSEFGDVDRIYRFGIFQGRKLRSELFYNDLNKVNDLIVNLYPKHRHGN
ncbi:hypothetical protein [Pedobacter panaciterrae]